MTAFLFYALPIAAFILYFNTIAVIHQVRDGEKGMTISMLVGACLMAFVIFALFYAGIAS